MTQPVPVTTEAILQNLIRGVRTLLTEAGAAVLDAEAAIYAGNRNGAIGSLLPIEPILRHATALTETTLFIHRRT